MSVTWRRRGCRDCGSLSASLQRLGDHDKDVGDPYNDWRWSSFDGLETLSPNTSRRKIAEMESRIADLTTISDCMSTRLGQAERSLRDLNLTSVDDGMHVTTMRRRPTATDFAWSDDDDDDDVKMRLGRCHRRTSSTKRDELRREIAKLREDVRFLKHWLSSRSLQQDYFTDSNAACTSSFVANDDVDSAAANLRHRQLYDSESYADRRGFHRHLTSAGD